MREQKRSLNAQVGIGLVELLTVLFISFKLCGVIQWSWWWVLSPMWISVVFAMLVLVILLIVHVRPGPDF